MSNILLFVDDSATMQIIAEITFRDSDWEYKGARTADDAQRIASDDSPAMILVDAVLANESGYRLAGDLKSAHPDAALVMVCGNSESYNTTKGDEVGCIGSISKPWQTDKIITQLTEFAEGATLASPAKPTLMQPGAPSQKTDGDLSRSATLMGMPAIEMPPRTSLPSGVAPIRATTKRPTFSVPTTVTPPRTLESTPPVGPPSPELPKIAASLNAAKPVSSPAVSAAPRPPMIKAVPGKPIRLVLASQAMNNANQAAEAGGLSSEQARVLGDVSRELLEQVIWDVVPDLAEAIIRENLETLTAKAR